MISQKKVFTEILWAPLKPMGPQNPWAPGSLYPLPPSVARPLPLLVHSKPLLPTDVSLRVCHESIDTFRGFKRSSKYSLHRERISFSSARMLPAESLMECVTLDLMPRKRRMVCQNTFLPKNS